ncbi:MAG: hypothetical protein HYZ93_05205, partial [Candidatus Omnitrophica bacterium]|nr:hypothetical protein [Candidatus Omnitrophota bacterium]
MTRSSGLPVGRLAGAFWRFVIRHRSGFPDPEAQRLKGDILDLGVKGVERVEAVQVYYVGGKLAEEELQRLGAELLTDPITQEFSVREIGSLPPVAPGDSRRSTVEVAYHPGVRDPVEDSLRKGALDLGIAGIRQVHTAKEYTLSGRISSEDLSRIC